MRTNSIVTRWSGALVVPLILLLALSVSLGSHEAEPYPGYLPTMVRIYSSQSIQYEQYSEDHFLHQQTRIEYPDGISEQVYRYASGGVEERIQLYPPQEAANQRIIKRYEHYGPDGLLLAERTNRPDGTAELIGTRLDDGSYDSRILDASGLTALQHVIALDSGVILLDEQFHGDGTISSSNQRHDDGSYAFSTYRSNGTLEYRRMSLFGVVFEESFYYPDGETVHYHFIELGSSMRQGTRYRRDGTISEVRTWNYNGTINTLVYDTNETPYLRQFWIPHFDEETLAYLMRLSMVEELLLLDDGKTQIVRSIDLSYDGTFVRRVRVRWDIESASAVNILYTFRQEDGTLESVEIKNADNEIVSIEEHTSAEAIRETLPARYTVLTTFPDTLVPIPNPMSQRR